MDYFKERRAYRNFKMFERRVSQAQNDLYRELLDYANDQGVLDKSFHLMNDALLKLTGLNETTMFNARNKLVQFGLITYDKGKRNLDTPVYQIIKLYEDWGRTNTKTGDDTGVTSGVEPVDDTGGNLFTNTRHDLTITQQHNKKPDDSTNLPIQKLSDYYQHNIGVIRPLILEDMRAYLDDFIEQGTDSEEATQIIKLAIKIAVDNNKSSWSYASACLKNWTNESLFTLESIKAARAQRQTARQKIDGNRYSRKTQVEAVTDWDKKQAKPFDPNELVKLQEEWKRYKSKGVSQGHK